MNKAIPSESASHSLQRRELLKEVVQDFSIRINKQADKEQCTWQRHTRKSVGSSITSYWSDQRFIFSRRIRILECAVTFGFHKYSFLLLFLAHMSPANVVLLHVGSLDNKERSYSRNRCTKCFMKHNGL